VLSDLDNEENFLALMNAINEIAANYGMPVIYSTHPRSRNIIEKRNFNFHPLVRSIKPFGFFDYNKLQLNAYCVLSDSGTAPEEASILGFPAVSIRTSTERPEALDKGAILLGGIKKEDVMQAVELCRAMWEQNEQTLTVPDYQDTNISVKVIKIIQSYTHIINKVVWGKNS
jgi:UDP-N-acetylglucosamine 2-epimerase (non-hydrolysing)